MTNKDEVKNYHMPPGFYNADCMTEMWHFQDKFFDLYIKGS